MIRYFLNGTECDPKNKDSVNYVFDFSDRQLRELELSVDTLEFVREDFDAIKQWLSLYGNFVGMPLNIQYSNGQVVKYLLDFADPSFQMRERGCSVKLKRYKAIDNFFDNADGLSFGIINWQESDFTLVDYVIIPEQQASYYLSLSLATYSLARELSEAVKSISEGIADLAEVLPPVPGNLGAVVSAGIKLAARIAYAISIIIALTKLSIEIINVIFQPIRQFKGVSFRRLLQKGCGYLGYTLQSNLLNQLAPLTILPVPLKPKDGTWFFELIGTNTSGYTNGYPSSRDTIQTLGQAVKAIENTFNAKTSVIDGVVRIEQETFFENTPNTGLLNAFNMQDAMQSEYTLNSEELFKRMVVQYQVDPSDFNTFDDTFQNLYEISSETLSSPDRSYELFKGFDLVDIPFARGTNKGNLNFLEEAARGFAKAIDLFTNGNLSAKIEARKNALQISSQYFNNTKLLWMQGSKLHPNQTNFIGCQAIANKYWYSRFIENNQRRIYENVPVAMTESELFALMQNNYIIANDGQVVEITSIQWSEREHFATVSLRVPQQSINEKTLIIDDGI
jgi:hypothetical protein